MSNNWETLWDHMLVNSIRIFHYPGDREIYFILSEQKVRSLLSWMPRCEKAYIKFMRVIAMQGIASQPYKARGQRHGKYGVRLRLPSPSTIQSSHVRQATHG